MLNQMLKSKSNKLLTLLLICIFSFTMVVPAQAANGDGAGGPGAGTNPLTYKGAYLTTTNHKTETVPLKQTSTPGDQLDDNNNVPSGPQTIDIWIDKNIIADAHYAQNTACITLKDVNTSSNAALTFFRLGATDGTGVYKQHIYFDATLIGGHNYTITIDAGLTANNGLTLGTTQEVNFTTAAANSGSTSSGTSVGTGIGTGTSTVILRPDFFCAETNAEGTMITAAFSKAMASLPAAPAGFTVTIDGVEDTVKEVALNSDTSEIDLILTTPIKNGQVVTLDYSGLTVTSADRGVLASFRDQPVTNNVSGLPLTPTVTSAAISARLGGLTAVQTAIQIADQTGWTGAAILSSSANYGMVDALTAGPLAAFLKAPILLQETGNVLNTDTKSELNKLNVKTVYVTSGTGVISQAVLDQLTGMGITVVPLGGVDRFATSVNIAQKMVELGAEVSKVAVAYGWQNEDALSIASIASAQTEPILLIDKDIIPESVKAFLNTNTSVKRSDVIGGTGVISDAVKDQLPSATRHSGNTAYDTNVAVLKAFDGVLNYDQVFVANGETAIDALAGVPLAAKFNAGLVLTNGTINEGMTYVNSKLSASSVATALGGTAVVPDSVLTGASTEAELKAINAGTEVFADFASAGVPGAVERNKVDYDKLTALTAINEGTEVLADYATAGITGVVGRNKAEYDTAIATAKTKKGSSLTLKEVQTEVGVVNEAAVSAALTVINFGKEIFSDFATAGVTGAVAVNKADYDIAIDAARRRGSTSFELASLTLEDVQAQVGAVNEAAPAAALTAINEGEEVFADFTTAGVTGAVGRNKAGYDKAIAEVKTRIGYLTLGQVQTAIRDVNKAAAEVALASISGGKEAFADFGTAGVIGVFAGNIVGYDKAIAIAKTTKGSNLTLEEVQTAVDVVNSAAAVALKAINGGIEMFADFVTAGVTGAVESNKTGYDTAIATAKTTKGSGLTLAEVQTAVGVVNVGVATEVALAAINEGIAVFADFATAGVTGAVLGKIDNYNTVITIAKKTKGSDLTLADVQTHVDNVNASFAQH